MSSSRSTLRYLWAYSAGDDWTRAWHQRLIKRRRELGYNVTGFCVTPMSLGGRWFPFPELDRRWTSADAPLLQMYSDLADALSDRDVLILYNGANLHPEFVSWLKVIKVYTAGDDPESTEILTKPAAPAFDIHLVNNIACLDMYRSWGLKRVHFWPLGSLRSEHEVAHLTEARILNITERKIPLAFFGGRTNWRNDRLDQLVSAFPDAYYAGSGWPRGVVDWSEMWSTYEQTQIGWNLHNSTGPINFRSYDLPASGVMQVCDNKAHLGEIYEIGREVVGFDTMRECIDLTRYYLAHPDEQREIALAGWRRWLRDYTPDRVWQRLVNVVGSHSFEFKLPVTEDVSSVKAKLRRHARRASLRSSTESVSAAFRQTRVYHSLQYRYGEVKRKLFRS